MASFAKGARIIKNLSPEQLSQILGQWVLGQNNIEAERHYRVELQFAMTRTEGCATQFKSCRVDVEVE